MSQQPESQIDIALTVNGVHTRQRVEARRHLADFLREALHLTGTHVGCEHGVCGACTVRVDGKIVRACLMLAVQCNGSVVETIEGLSDDGSLEVLQREFRRRNALQCGFCTPGMLITAADLLSRTVRPTRNEIREHLSGNYCRCTGYHAIVDAVDAAIVERVESERQS
jgi:carbon-monoxide dehydrogenase small subunit